VSTRPKSRTEAASTLNTPTASPSRRRPSPAHGSLPPRPAEVRAQEVEPAVLGELHRRVQRAAPERVVHVRALGAGEEDRDAAERPDVAHRRHPHVRHGDVDRREQLPRLGLERRARRSPAVHDAEERRQVDEGLPPVLRPAHRRLGLAGRDEPPIPPHVRLEKVGDVPELVRHGRDGGEPDGGQLGQPPLPVQLAVALHHVARQLFRRHARVGDEVSGDRVVREALEGDVVLVGDEPLGPHAPRHILASRLDDADAATVAGDDVDVAPRERVADLLVRQLVKIGASARVVVAADAGEVVAVVPQRERDLVGRERRLHIVEQGDQRRRVAHVDLHPVKGEVGDLGHLAVRDPEQPGGTGRRVPEDEKVDVLARRRAHEPLRVERAPLVEVVVRAHVDDERPLCLARRRGRRERGTCKRHARARDYDGDDRSGPEQRPGGFYRSMQHQLWSCVDQEVDGWVMEDGRG